MTATTLTYGLDIYAILELTAENITAWTNFNSDILSKYSSDAITFRWSLLRYPTPIESKTEQKIQQARCYYFIRCNFAIKGSEAAASKLIGELAEMAKKYWGSEGVHAWCEENGMKPEYKWSGEAGVDEKFMEVNIEVVFG
jgi:hypothetical protein